MRVEPGQNPDLPSPRCYRGPQGLGEEAARALEQNSRPNSGGSGLEEQAFLRQWAEEEGCLIPPSAWESLHLVADHTLEHQVRFRESDYRAVKRTLPGSFGFVPAPDGSKWVPRPANAGEYLHRLHLQNLIFGDEIQLEGGMVVTGGPFILGQPTGGFAFVISQPWLEAADNKQQYPSEAAVDEFLRGMGFERLLNAFYGWRSTDQSLVILDAKPDNFIATPDGILPIDLLLAEVFSSN